MGECSIGDTSEAEFYIIFMLFNVGLGAVLQKRGAGSTDGCGAAKGGGFFVGGSPKTCPKGPVPGGDGGGHNAASSCVWQNATLRLSPFSPWGQVPVPGGDGTGGGEKGQKWVTWVTPRDPECNGMGPLARGEAGTQAATAASLTSWIFP